MIILSFFSFLFFDLFYFHNQLLQFLLQLYIPLPAKIFLGKLAPSVTNNLLRNPSLCSLASFRNVSLTPSGNKLESSRYLTISIMSFFHHLILLVLYYYYAKRRAKDDDLIIRFFYVFLHLLLMLLQLILKELKDF